MVGVDAIRSLRLLWLTLCVLLQSATLLTIARSLSNPR